VSDALERENRILERRLKRLEANVKRLEDFQETNSTLLSGLLRDLEIERARSQRLLLNVLPQRVVDRLAAGATSIADRHDDATVLLGDLVGFTSISASMPAAQLVEELNEMFRGFDAICDRHGVEKIKTVGDAYLVVGGLAGDPDSAAAAIADAAIAMTALLGVGSGRWQIRIGLHCGPLVAGVVGTSKFAYDVWGDTVNTASRLQTTSDPGRVHTSAVLAQRLGDRFVFEPRGTIDIKGKGPMDTAYLVGRRPG
jgi:class 3 adenylate cyclase